MDLRVHFQTHLFQPWGSDNSRSKCHARDESAEANSSNKRSDASAWIGSSWKWNGLSFINKMEISVHIICNMCMYVHDPQIKYGKCDHVEKYD